MLFESGEPFVSGSVSGSPADFVLADATGFVYLSQGVRFLERGGWLAILLLAIATAGIVCWFIKTYNFCKTKQINGQFESTPWNVIAVAQSGAAAAVNEELRQLCRQYYESVYRYIQTFVGKQRQSESPFKRPIYGGWNALT